MDSCHGPAAKCSYMQPGAQELHDPLLIPHLEARPPSSAYKLARRLLELPDHVWYRQREINECFGADNFPTRAAIDFIPNQEKENNALPEHYYCALSNVGPVVFTINRQQFSSNSKSPPVGLAILCDKVEGYERYKPYPQNSNKPLTSNNTNLSIDNKKTVGPYSGNYNTPFGSINVDMLCGKNIAAAGGMINTLMGKGKGHCAPQEYNNLASDSAAASIYYFDPKPTSSPKHIMDAAAAASLMSQRMLPTGVLAAFGQSSSKMAAGNLAPRAADGGVAWSSEPCLIVDTGASIHAVGDYMLLREFQPYERPKWVTLPDGTWLRNLGIGRLEREGLSIPNVSLIEGFQRNLISISQLDRDHHLYSYFGQGICEIFMKKPDGIFDRVGGAILEDDGMYVLRFLNVPPEPAQE